MRFPLWSANVGIVLALLFVASGSLRNEVFSVALANSVQLINEKTALVSGEFSCTGVSGASVSAVMTQRQGKTDVTGTGDLGLSSTGGAQVFSLKVAVVQPPNGAFTKGPANLVVDVSCGMGTQTMTALVRLGQ